MSAGRQLCTWLFHTSVGDLDLGGFDLADVDIVDTDLGDTDVDNDGSGDNSVADDSGVGDFGGDRSGVDRFGSVVVVDVGGIGGIAVGVVPVAHVAGSCHLIFRPLRMHSSHVAPRRVRESDCESVLALLIFVCKMIHFSFLF